MSRRSRVAELDADALFDALTRAHIEYVLIGGFAVAAHGFVRATEDLDICPNPAEDNLRRLAALLDELGAEPLDIAEFAGEHEVSHHLAGLAGGGNFRLLTKFGALDVLQYLAPFDDDSWRQLNANAEVRELSGNRIRVCSSADLLAMKAAAGRDQDLIDIRNLKAARGES